MCAPPPHHHHHHKVFARPPPAAAVVTRRSPAFHVYYPQSGDRVLLTSILIASVAAAPGGIPVERAAGYTPVAADRPPELLPSTAVTRCQWQTTCARITLGCAAR